VHSNFEDLIKRGKFHDLIHAVYEDLCDIGRLFTITEEGEARVFEITIRTIVKEWFTNTEENPAQPQAWRVSDTLLEYQKSLRQSDQPDPEKHKKVMQDIARACYQQPKA
jgi:hypothetical protein